MWEYSQTSGDLYHVNSVGEREYTGRGYSGHPPHVNDPSAQAAPGSGPIPRGRYVIGKARTSANTGPLTMNLDPMGHNALGRTLLRIHGDNKLGNRSASHGCIILGRAIRTAIIASGDTVLKVIE